MEDLVADPQALRKLPPPSEYDHELLEVDLVVGVGASVEHVHHRHRQQSRGVPAEVPPQGQPPLGGLCLCGRQRHAKDRVGAQARLVGGPVELDQRAVKPLLVGGVEAVQLPRDLGVGVLDGAPHPPSLPRLTAVAQLGRLELAGRGAGGHRGPPACAGA
jgi:hypothetical protein